MGIIRYTSYDCLGNIIVERDELEISDKNLLLINELKNIEHDFYVKTANNIPISLNDKEEYVNKCHLLKNDMINDLINYLKKDNISYKDICDIYSYI